MSLLRRSHHLNSAGPDHRGNDSTGPFGKLYGRRANAAAGTINQELRTRLYIHQGIEDLQGSRAGNRKASCFFEGD